MQMRKSVVLEKLRKGEVACSFKLNLADSRAAEIAAMFGFDCLWLDQEHVANDWSVIEKQILAAKAYNVDCLVRVARGSYSDYVRPLELDATGIMVPHLMSLADAKNVVRTVRFHPIGRRPIDGGNADGAYCNIDFLSYLKEANRERFVIVQIEDPEPLAELDAIAAVEGIDMLLFGPGDFSHGIGAPAQYNHPVIIEARKRIVETARAHGKFAGTVGAPEEWESLIAMGYQFLNAGADVIGLSQYCRDMIRRFRKT